MQQGRQVLPGVAHTATVWLHAYRHIVQESARLGGTEVGNSGLLRSRPGFTAQQVRHKLLFVQRQQECYAEDAGRQCFYVSNTHQTTYIIITFAAWLRSRVVMFAVKSVASQPAHDHNTPKALL